MTTLSENHAITIAREYAESQGWPWHSEEIHAWFNGHGSWFVTTRPDTEWTANVSLGVDDETGKVFDATFRPDVVDPISRRRALEIARTCVLENGWSWRAVEICKDEFDCHDGRRANTWAVSTNRDRMGGNATLILDAETGELLDTYYATR